MSPHRHRCQRLSEGIEAEHTQKSQGLRTPGQGARKFLGPVLPFAGQIGAIRLDKPSDAGIIGAARAFCYPHLIALYGIFILE